ncbi:hypothetical protein APX70_03902 [Pseudomonas syringae pv. maculicola]|uniref:Uncharacterized protein n=1 Tax=Pseudomonas syringae pv. maculicola TaxID=59511 RepID=A0A3M2U5A0_PSEYM|nr:hypothetical protein APX70_03902 [Pseudomonas syringae pv. maculicola]
MLGAFDPGLQLSVSVHRHLIAKVASVADAGKVVDTAKRAVAIGRQHTPQQTLLSLLGVLEMRLPVVQRGVRAVDE